MILRSALVAVVAAMTLTACPTPVNLPTPTPFVHLVPTCNVREFQYEVRYTGWYALLAELGGVEAIYHDTIAYLSAGTLQKVYMEQPFIPFWVGWSPTGNEPWHRASDTMTGWSDCI